MKEYWVYMLRCRDGSYYIGVTSELEIRVAKHALGIHPDAYTFRRRPVKLVYSEVFYTPEEAIFVEKRLKGWSRVKKDALVRGDWGAIRMLSRSSAPSRAVAEHRGAPFDKLRVTHRQEVGREPGLPSSARSAIVVHPSTSSG